MRLMCPWRLENTSSDGAGGSKPCGTKTLPIASRKIACSAGRSPSVVGRSSTTATIRQLHRRPDQQVERETEHEPDHHGQR